MSLTAGQGVGACLRALESRFANLERPAFLAGELLSRATGISRLELPLHQHQPLSETQAGTLMDWAGRLASGEPLPYVVGRASFRGLDLICDSRGLIPRPETEVLVEQVLTYPGLWEGAPPGIADVGTGSGCIVCSLCTERPEADYWAVDVCPEALSLARENAKMLGIEAKIRWREGDLLAGFKSKSLHAIVANLPYISTGEWIELGESVRNYEPSRALTGGSDGLNLVRHLSRQAKRVLVPNGVIFLELGETQGNQGAAFLESLAFRHIQIIPDLSGKGSYSDWRKLVPTPLRGFQKRMNARTKPPPGKAKHGKKLRSNSSSATLITIFVLAFVGLVLQIKWVGENKDKFVDERVQNVYAGVAEATIMPVVCYYCQGHGLINRENKAIESFCPVCFGVGKNQVKILEEREMLCGPCQGMGRYFADGADEAGTCGVCSGRGLVLAEKVKTVGKQRIEYKIIECDVCNTRGKIMHPKHQGLPMMCPTCFGVGTNLARVIDPDEDVCGPCGGMGFIYDEDLVESRPCGRCHTRGMMRIPDFAVEEAQEVADEAAEVTDKTFETQEAQL